MFSIQIQSDFLRELDQSSKELVSLMLPRLAPSKTRLSIKAAQKLCIDQSFYLIKQGLVRLSRKERGLVFFEEGDLIGFSQDLPEAAELYAESDLLLDAYQAFTPAAADKALSDLSSRYLRLQAQLAWEFLASSAEQQILNNYRLKMVHSKEAIIIQETSAYDVFLLVRGSVDVHLGETLVGEILPGEFFGTFNQFGQGQRTASVIARCDSIVAQFSQEQFQQYLSLHPEIAQRILLSMSRIIISQNQKISELTH